MDTADADNEHAVFPGIYRREIFQRYAEYDSLLVPSIRKHDERALFFVPSRDQFKCGRKPLIGQAFRIMHDGLGLS